MLAAEAGKTAYEDFLVEGLLVDVSYYSWSGPLRITESLPPIVMQLIDLSVVPLGLSWG